MVLHSVPVPAFGQADLSNCEREQIHLAASVQPHGALLVVSEPDYIIVQCSANASVFLNIPGAILGHSLSDLGGDLWERIQPHLSESLIDVPMAVGCHLGSPSLAFDGLLHRPKDGGLIIELEQAGPSVDLHIHVEKALQSILSSSSLRAHCDDTARLFQELTGYDRVMVYRFDDHGHGEVFSERRRPDLEAYLGNWYPASDIPQIARRLYERNRIRMIADIEYQPVALMPRICPLTGEDLDMSLCVLRSSSPIHVQYLKNMGVAATLVVSLMVGGRLWGLISCHHYQPKLIHFEARAACEVLAEAVATRIAALESFAQVRAELSVRRLEQRMIEAISRDGDWKMALFDGSSALLDPIGASGAALLFDGQVLTTGNVPGTQDLREIGAWLDMEQKTSIFASATFAADQPDFAGLTAVASGMIAAPVSSTPGDYIFWFRPERIHTVTWGGDPTKPVTIGNDPADLSPRRSFAQWHQLVLGTCEPWTADDLMAARLIGDTISDVALQFQSVRSLIAQDQLDRVSRQVRIADSPVMTADADGRLLLINEAFRKLLPPSANAIERMEDLADLFTEPKEVARSLRDLRDHQQPWRGEVRIKGSQNHTPSLLVRGDPVSPSPDRILGYVFLFTDLTQRKTAELARRRFQEGIIHRYAASKVRVESEADLLYQNLISSIVENAQVAALEITDSEDLTKIPGLLASVQNSVSRTAVVLKYLVSHATRQPEDKTVAADIPVKTPRNPRPRAGRQPPVQPPKRQY